MRFPAPKKTENIMNPMVRISVFLKVSIYTPAYSFVSSLKNVAISLTPALKKCKPRNTSNKNVSSLQNSAKMRRAFSKFIDKLLLKQLSRSVSVLYLLPTKQSTVLLSAGEQARYTRGSDARPRALAPASLLHCGESRTPHARPV